MVRRVSVNERSSLYRREHHKEAMVWQELGRQQEPQDEDEDRQTDNELNQQATVVSYVSYSHCEIVYSFVHPVALLLFLFFFVGFFSGCWRRSIVTFSGAGVCR